MFSLTMFSQNFLFFTFFFHVYVNWTNVTLNVLTICTTCACMFVYMYMRVCACTCTHICENIYIYLHCKSLVSLATLNQTAKSDIFGKFTPISRIRCSVIKLSLWFHKILNFFLTWLITMSVINDEISNFNTTILPLTDNWLRCNLNFDQLDCDLNMLNNTTALVINIWQISISPLATFFSFSFFMQ